jgi:glycosyltransferase involved in cell wall biosynthesis
MSLKKQDYKGDYEIIVVDDGSMDGTGDMIAREFPAVRYLRQANRGPAATRNLGIREATGDIVAFTDDDCLPPADWLARLAEGYALYPEAVGGGGGIIAPPDVLASSIFARYELYNGREVYHAREETYCGGFECPAGGTANMSYRRTVLLEVNGFDEGFPVAAGEDADLKLRICNLNYRLFYVPMWVTHLQEYSWARFYRQCYVRGIGRNYFEQRHGAGYPSRIKISLRIVRRLLTFPLDLVRMREKRLALVKLADGLITCRGQWMGR